MTLKNNRAPLLFYFKLVASFRNHWCIDTWVTVRKRPIWVKIHDFFSRVTSKFDVWPWKTIGHLFYATSSFVHHFIAIGEFKLELKSGNAQSGSNSTIFSAVWPWNLADDLEQGKSEGFDSCDLPSNLAQILSKSSIFQPVWAWNLMQDLKQGKSEGFESCDRPIIRKRCFVPCDLEIWWMTLENDRASLLCCFKLCATFHSHWWIQTGVTVWKRPIWVKFDDF